MAIVHDQITMTLGALAAEGATSSNTKIDSGRVSGVQMEFAKFYCEFLGKTAGEGPIYVGFCAADVGNTEITEAFAADPQVAKESQESARANRRVFPVWVLTRNETGGLATVIPVSMLQKVQLPSWKLRTGIGLNTFAINRGSGALTSGTVVRLGGVLGYRWLRAS